MSILTHDTNHTAADLHHGIADRFAGTFTAFWRYLVAAREAQARRLLAASLTDKQLRDLGIDRSESSVRRTFDPHTV